MDRLCISRNVFASRVARLQERGLIVNIVDFNPSRDNMLEWVTANFIQDLGIKITKLKVLAKFVFLIVLEKGSDRDKILKETPMFMSGKMVLVFPWDLSFDLKLIHTSTALVWVDLLTLHPVFEDLALELLGQVGEVVYVAPKYAQSKFSNVRGCVKVDLMKPLKDYVSVRMEGVGNFKIEVDFRTLPDAYFYCHKHRHLIRDCDLLKQQEYEEQLWEDEIHGTFCEVKCKRSSLSPKEGQRFCGLDTFRGYSSCPFAVISMQSTYKQE